MPTEPAPVTRDERARRERAVLRDGTPGPTEVRAPWICLAVFVVLICVHASGVVGWAYYVVIAGGCACSIVGLIQNRPPLRWPWVAFIGAGVLWAIAGSVTDLSGSVGDFSHDRSLVPDLFNLPAYLLFGAALYGLLQARRSSHEGGALLDGVILGVGALVVVSQLIIEPAMTLPDSWVMAQIVVALYPALSMCLLMLAARLAFTPGDQSPSFRLLLVGTAGLFVGDVAYALGEIYASVPQMVLEVPFLLPPACLRIARSTARRPPSLSRWRLVSVGGALLAPIVVIAGSGPLHETIATTTLCLILALAVVLRLATAMREQAAFEARLSHQATHDELTGLPGRTLVMERIDDLLARGAATDERVAVMFIDLDQFKLVNDSMGHGIGDQLLTAAAQRITACLDPSDTVGRISGDEFIVVGQHGQVEAFQIGERIRRVLADGFDLDTGEVFVSVSIGITVAQPGDRTTAATLIQEADTAMYRSKEAGRDRVTLFDASMRERVSRRVELERRLRHALNEGQVNAHFQPIVRLPYGRVEGFEALARWSDDGHMVSPAEFIPVAEESGLIVPLGASMLDEACRQVAAWRRTIAGADDLYVSVNLSVRQLRESDIVDTVAEVLARYQLPGAALSLEITESVMMEDSIAAASVMLGLRQLGVRLAVDDFGTGFSSLSYLKRFPVSAVKIDQAFVGGLGRHESDSSLVAAMVAMAGALELEPVAEGVETEEQARLLHDLGCRRAQGYLFGAAVPPEVVPDVIRRLRAIDTHTCGRTGSIPRRRAADADRCRPGLGPVS